MYRRLGLNIAKFVHAIVRELQMPQLMLRVGLVDAIHLTFENTTLAEMIAHGPSEPCAASDAAFVTTCIRSRSIN